MKNADMSGMQYAEKPHVVPAQSVLRIVAVFVAVVCWVSACGAEDFGLVSKTKWILFGKDFKEDLGRERFFRGAADVGEGLSRATANVWIDDVGDLTIDGVKVGGSVENADWTKFLFEPGLHLIAAKGKNVNGAGGLCVAIELEYKDGHREHVHTSAAWEASEDGNVWRPATVACDALGGTWPRYRAMSAFLSADERQALQGLHRARRARTDRVLASLKGPAPACRVVYDRGRSRFVFGDRSLEATYYNLSEGWRDDNSELRRQIAGFRDAGMHLYGLGCRISAVWLPDGSIDFEKLVESMSGVLAIDPEAHFMFCFAQVVAPAWWVKAHPDELVGYAGGTVDPKEKNDIRNVATASMASEVWRQDFSDFLTRAIRHLEGTPFADRIIAYRIDYGIHHEWHYYGMRDRLFPDNGKAMTAAFRRWTGDPKAEVPGAAERSEAPVEGWLRDPVKQARVIAYERCHAAVVRDCVLAVDKAAKEACGGRCLVGNYCGYFFGMGANPAEGWHLENDAILDSPYVDFQASPQVYGPSARNPGNPQYARCLLEGLRRRGKVALLEADNSPVRAATSYCSFSKTKADDEALYARDFAQALCWGCGFWYFDFGRGWYGADFNDYFRRIYPIRSRPADCSSVAEVLYVGDYESVMFSAVPGKGQERTNAATTELITTLGHVGVPFDTASMKDLTGGKLKDYRVYVFGNLHYLTREKLAAVKRLRECGVMLVFVGKESGLLTPDGVRPETAAELQALGRVAEIGRDAAYWKGLFREFGVHVYNEDEAAAFYANAGYAALHVGKAGHHRISLPRRMKVTELYPERKDLGMMSSFNFESRGAETFIFATEPAEASVEHEASGGKDPKIVPHARAGLLPVHADSAWLRMRAVEIAKTAQTELDGFRAELKDLRSSAEAVFVAAPDAIERERVFKRLWIAEDTCRFVAHYLRAGDPSSLQFVERGLEDLRLMKEYFVEELSHWRANPFNPDVSPIVLNAADYGIVGDGKTPNGAAFQKVFDDVRKLGGKPCIVKVPAGVYRFRERQVSPRWRHENQFTVSCLTNAAIVGDSPETTKFVWGVYDCSGGAVEDCVNLTVRGFEVYWERNPFTEGLVVEANADEGSCVMVANPRAMRPTEECFKAALTCQFDVEGKICLDSYFAWLDPMRPVEDLGGNRYKLYFNRTNYGGSYRQVKPNRTICLPDREDRFHGFRIFGGGFVTFDTLWFRNSRAAAFSTCRAHQTCATRCRIFPMDGCTLSTCADGYYTSSGSYLAHSDFTRMHDDANNAHARGLYLYGQIGEDTLAFLWDNGLPKRGDLMLLTSPLSGQYLGNVRVAEDAVRTNWHGNTTMLTVRFESLPPGLHTFESLGMKAFTREEQKEIVFGRKKVDRMPDHIYTPGQSGVASVVTDCHISSLRNVGLPIQAPNELVESNVIENISMGLNLCALVQWMEGPPPYHTIVRDNVIRDCGIAINSVFMMPDHGAASVAPILGCRFERNRFENSIRKALALRNMSDATFCGNVFIGGSSEISTNQCGKIVFKSKTKRKE